MPENNADIPAAISLEINTESVGRWSDRCIEKARQAHPVPHSVSHSLLQQLIGVASERALRPSELTALSQKLLTALDESSDEEAGT